VALLPQRPVFVAGSLADNLRLGAPDAAEDRLWEALRRVALDRRVHALPEGLDTPLGEDGATLSGGERARLALARVLLADRPWVLLDEPAAHLDEQTERVVAAVVAELGRSRGVVVVAHRPALVDLADRVIALPPPVAPPAVPSSARHDDPPRAVPVIPSDGPAVRPAGLGTSAILGGLASASGVALTATAGWLIVQASYQPAILTLLVAIVGVRTFGLARPVLRYIERVRSHDVALRLLARRRVAVYDAVVPLTPGALGRRRGDLLASIVDDVDSVVDREIRVRLPVRGFVLAASLSAAVALPLAPSAGLVVLTTSAAAGGLGHAVARAGASRAERDTVLARAALSRTVVEMTQTALELAMWQTEGRAVADVVGMSGILGRSTARAATWVASARALVLVLAGAGVAGVALVSAPLVAHGSISGPVLALLVLLPLALGEVAADLTTAGALAGRTRAAEARLAELTRRRPAVTEPEVPLPAGGTDLRAARLVAAWDDRVVLDDLCLELHPGDRLGVVGPSGSGKSTLAALLLRFVDPVGGRIAMGGRDLDALALDDVHARVGLVDDDPHVFATTVAENVRLARPSAGDGDVDAALRLARLGPWLDSLPEGIHTWVGEGHAEVSGGERARMALARSLLADQPVLVLDEPTAHLDHATAVETAETVLGAASGRSLVWITHDGVGLDRMDRVLRLEVQPLSASMVTPPPAG
jgi:ATP-binding cassette subfamily C protein CydCD